MSSISSADPSAVKVALVGPTVGQTRRGYERFLTDLHRCLEDDSTIDATLFKGAGECRPGEFVVTHLSRTGRLARVFGDRLRYPRYHLEFLSFALSVGTKLVRGAYDVVHYIDPPLGPLLGAIRNLSGARFRLLFTDAGPVPHDGLRHADHVHCLTPRALEEKLASGAARERVSMIPVGIDSRRFHRTPNRADSRARWGIADDTFVVLCVAALNRHHKRIDYLIEEAARTSRKIVLWLDGGFHPDGDQSLVELGKRRLGENFRYSHVDSESLPELYASADVFVSTSLDEPFGMAIVEAMSCGIPVVTHDSEHFRWLTGGIGKRADLREPGNLASILSELATGQPCRKLVDPASALRRFDWKQLARDYATMYRDQCPGRDSVGLRSVESSGHREMGSHI